jgi:hypothetical protein
MAACGGPPIAASGGVINGASGGGGGGCAALLERARQAEEAGPCARDALCADAAVASALLRFAKARLLSSRRYTQTRPVALPCRASLRRSARAHWQTRIATHRRTAHTRMHRSARGTIGSAWDMRSKRNVRAAG